MIELEERGDVTILRMARGKGNALNVEFLTALDETLARIGLSEILVGVIFPAWALEIARFATPREHFSTLILTGRSWLPEDALARGLVDELVEPGELLDRACAVATEMGAVPSKTFAAT